MKKNEVMGQVSMEAMEALAEAEKLTGTVEGTGKPVMPEPEPGAEKKAGNGDKKPVAKKTGKAGGKESGKKAKIVKSKGPSPAEVARAKKEFMRRDSAIAKNIANIEKSFLIIAFNLYWIREGKLYKQAGFKNVYDYAEERYNLGKTSCSNLICIVDNYAERDENGNVMEQIAVCYRRFKQSQLIAMFGMTPEQIAEIDEKASVRKINEIRKSREIVQEDDGEEDKAPADSGQAVKTMEKKVLAQFSEYNEYLRNLEEIEKKMQKAFREHAGNVVVQIVYTK